MEVCKTCGSSDFTLWDGFYFCSECQTQSQNLREEKEETDEKATFHATSLKIGSVKTRTDKKLHNDYSYRWTTIDAFNIILKKIVDIVIDLGATYTLKETILRLWCYYLKKTKRAFCNKTSHTWIPRLEMRPRERDEQILFGNGTEIRCTKWLQSTKKFRALRKKEARKCQRQTLRGIVEKKTRKESKNKNEKASNKEENLISDTVDSFKVDELLEEENTLFGLRPPNTSTPKRKLFSPDARKFKKTIEPARLDSSRLSLSRISEFLYLGLLLVNDRLLLCDLLRLIDYNLIPLCGAHNLLPEYMTFQVYDNCTFRLQETPSYDSVRNGTSKLARYLNIEDLPEKCLQTIVGRFILELNLPWELQHMVNQLILICPSQLKFKKSKKLYNSVPNYEGRALAYIFVALKLLHGFDGITERKQSQFSQKLSLLLKDLKPFIWEDWVNFINIRSHKIQQFTILKHLDNPARYPYTDDLIGFYITNGLPVKGQLMKKIAKRKYYREDMGKTIRYPLENIMESLPNSNTQAAVNVSSFPASYAANHLLPPGSDNFSNLNVDFSTSVIYHLLKPKLLKTVLKEMNVKLIIKKTNPCRNVRTKRKKTTRISSKIKNDKNTKDKLHTKAGASVSSKDKINRNTKKTVTGKSQIHKTENGLSSDNIKVSRLVVNEPFHNYAFNDFKRRMKINEFNQLPQSALWLLNLLGETGHMKPDMIFREVALIEKVLFCSLKCMIKRKTAFYSMLNYW